MRLRRLGVAVSFIGLLKTLWADDASQFEEYLKYSQEVVAKQHLIVYAEFEARADSDKKIEFRYDHYPELERIQKGGSFVRKKRKTWVKSDDWGETGKAAPASVTNEFETWIGLLNAPLHNVHQSHDKSQGGVVPTLMKGDDGAKPDEIVFELRREHSTATIYPRFAFAPFPGKALIHTFAGPMCLGNERIMAHFRYDFMFQVQMEMVTPTPTPPDTAALQTGSPMMKRP